MFGCFAFAARRTLNAGDNIYKVTKYATSQALQSPTLEAEPVLPDNGLYTCHSMFMVGNVECIDITASILSSLLLTAVKGGGASRGGGTSMCRACCVVHAWVSA